MPWQSKKTSQSNPLLNPTTIAHTDQPTPSDTLSVEQVKQIPEEPVGKNEEQVDLKEEQSQEHILQEQETQGKTQQTLVQEELSPTKEESRLAQLDPQESQTYLYEGIYLQEQHTGTTQTQEEQVQMTSSTQHANSELLETTDPEKTISLVVKPPAVYNL